VVLLVYVMTSCFSQQDLEGSAITLLIHLILFYLILNEKLVSCLVVDQKELQFM